MYTSSIRTRTIKLIFTALLWLFHSSHSHAINHDELTLNGMSSHWVLNNELYVGALFLESKANTTEAIMTLSGRKRMEFRITTDKWRSRSFKKTWARSISINIDDADQKEYSNEIIRFSNMLKGPLLYGDKITIDYTPRKHTRVFLNNIQIFYTSNSDFFHAILSAWIGARPPSSDFKNNILVLNKSNLDVQDAMGRYDYIRPDLENQRKKEIESWVKSKPAPKPAAKPAPKPAPKPIAPVSAPKPASTSPTVKLQESPKADSTTTQTTSIVAQKSPKPAAKPASTPTQTASVSVQESPKPAPANNNAFDSLLDEMEMETAE